jgi:hypothetical protein
METDTCDPSAKAKTNSSEIILNRMCNHHTKKELFES